MSELGERGTPGHPAGRNQAASTLQRPGQPPQRIPGPKCRRSPAWESGYCYTGHRGDTEYQKDVQSATSSRAVVTQTRSTLNTQIWSLCKARFPSGTVLRAPQAGAVTGARAGGDTLAGPWGAREAGPRPKGRGCSRGRGTGGRRRGTGPPGWGGRALTDEFHG